MRGKTVAVRFDGQREVRAGSVTQYDYGQVLVFQDITLPATFEVYFGASMNGQAQKMIGHDNEVLVPDTIVESPGVKYAWVFLHEGADDGETEYIVMFNVGPRGEDSGTEPTPVQQDIITEAIAALNAGVSEVEGIAEAIPETVAAALTEAKASGEFDGPPGEPGADGADGVTFTPSVSVEGIISWTNDGGRENPESVDIKGPAGDPGSPGKDGEDGVSPAATVTQTAGGAEIRITDATGTTTAEVLNGTPGTPGQDGVSPTVSVSEITGGHRVSVTDAQGTETFDVMDGQDGDPGAPGDPGPAGPGVASGGTQGQMLVKKSATDYDTEWANPPSVPVTDVQVNGTSVLSSGVANVKVKSGTPLIFSQADGLTVDTPGNADIKAGSTWKKALTPELQHASAFYGLAKAAGDSTQSSSSNPVGTYTESAKSAISQMLNAPEMVSGTTPTITAKAGVQYVCGEVATLTVTLPATGCIDVIFESGSTPTVLTVTPPSGKTMQWPDWFDPTALEANATYEINVLNGTLGTVGVWT